MNAMKEAVPEDVRSHILFESFYNLAVMEDGSLALPMEEPYPSSTACIPWKF